jgi:hypothetical protein
MSGVAGNLAWSFDGPDVRRARMTLPIFSAAGLLGNGW